MSQFNRFKPRTDTYGNWEKANNNTPGGLKIMEGEICVIIADAFSAAAGLSNITAQPGPLTERFANTGEILGTKIGQGYELRWDEIPCNYHVPTISYPNGTGRVLGTQNNGASHVYKHPGQMFQAIFKGVYSAPEVGVSITSNGGDINGALYEVGQPVPNVSLNVSPYMRTKRIKRGRAFEETNGTVQIGTDQTADDPNTISNFSRAVDDFRVSPALGAPNRGDGLFKRRFFADVTDARESAEGGENTAQSGRVEVYGGYPVFFGKSTAALPADPTQLGAWLQANTQPTVRGRWNYTPGAINYANGERPIIALPDFFGPLARILDILGLNQLDTSGAFNLAPKPALVSKTVNGLTYYEKVAYRVYTTGAGFNGDFVFDYQF